MRPIVSIHIELRDDYSDHDFVREVAATLREIAIMSDCGEICREVCDKYTGPRGTNVTIIGGVWSGIQAPQPVPETFVSLYASRASVSCHHGLIAPFSSIGPSSPDARSTIVLQLP